MKRLLWIVPVLLAFCAYGTIFPNFFAFDDFVWLNRARILGNDWRQLFHPDVLYFDPLIYLLFFADLHIAGLDPRWYHGVDIAIHATNAVLVYRLGILLSDDELASLYASILFATSFAVADAVIWPSSRVDLVSVMFSLGTLILFLKYLRAGNSRFLCGALLLFVFSLGAKGTPTVLPIILLWFLFSYRQPLGRFVSLIPFSLLAGLYLVLVRSALASAGTPPTALHLSLKNLALAVCDLFIPEPVVQVLDPSIASLGLALFVVPLGVLIFSPESSCRLRRTGIVVMASGLLPVLVLKDFKLASYDNPITLLSSPSHRIYLAFVGVALTGGGVLRSLQSVIERYSARAGKLAVSALLMATIIFNVVEIRERGMVWARTGTKIFSGLNGLLGHRARIVEDGFVGLVNFPGADGFLSPMIETYFGLDRVTAGTTKTLGIVEDPEILKRAARSSFFVLARDQKVHDFSDQFRALLVLSRQASLNPTNPEYAMQVQTLATRMNWQIMQLLPEDAEF